MLLVLLIVDGSAVREALPLQEEQTVPTPGDLSSCGAQPTLCLPGLVFAALWEGPRMGRVGDEEASGRKGRWLYSWVQI